MRSTVAALFFLLAFVAMPAHANALHRCIGTDGGSIFTDQACDDIGASMRPEPAPASASGTASTSRLRSRSCARTTDGLLHGLRAALASGDVNQVAAFYHWPGITSAGSEDILKRLQTLATRQVVSAELIRQHPPPDADGFQTVASGQESEASVIELVQTRSGADATPVRTVFALTPYMGCWWVHF
jgi:hypothetical protein